MCHHPLSTLVLLLFAGAAFAINLNGFEITAPLVPAEEILPGGPPRDGIPAIDAPRFVAAHKAAFLKDRDPVIGLRYRNSTRAYPIAILNWHEVVNDTVDGAPVAITYCPLCGTGMAFLASSRGRTLRFGVSGLLYNSDVLLYDRETDSLWSQLMSKAVSGALKGSTLVTLAVDHTSWADWRARNPDTVVLSPETGFARDYGRDPYAGYREREELMFPVRFSDARLHPKERVIGISLGASHKAYPFSTLARLPGPVSDRLGDREIRIQFDPVSGSARIFDRSGAQLPSVTAYWFAWHAFHPEGTVFKAPGGSK